MMSMNWYRNWYKFCKLDYKFNKRYLKNIHWINITKHKIHSSQEIIHSYKMNIVFCLHMINNLPSMLCNMYFLHNNPANIILHIG